MSATTAFAYPPAVIAESAGDDAGSDTRLGAPTDCPMAGWWYTSGDDSDLQPVSILPTRDSSGTLFEEDRSRLKRALPALDRRPEERAAKVIDDSTSVIDKISSDRAELLAREFARGQLSQEERARLALLDQRLNDLAPTVTEAEIEQMETLEVKRNQSVAKLETIRKKLGLR